MKPSQRILAFALMIFLIGVSCSQFWSTPAPTSAPGTPDNEDYTLHFSPDILPDARQGIPYEVKVQVTNDKTFVAQFTVKDGSLPPGLALERVPSEDAVLIKGIPTESGTFAFTLNIICFGTNDPGQEGDHPYQIVVK